MSPRRCGRRRAAAAKFIAGGTNLVDEYHIPTNADTPEIDVIFVDEQDDKTSPLGVKGLGKIGIVATPAAVANAIFHATGKRLRSLPITIDKVRAG